MCDDEETSGRPGFSWRFAPGWPSGYGPRPRQGGVPPAQMRVSDAERSEIAEALSKHFGDGRLDQAEFDERMTKAMSAKTRGDLAGLLDDLPPIPGPPPGTAPVPPPGYAPVVHHRHDRFSTLALAVLVLVLVQASFSAWFWHPAVLWISILAAVVLVSLRSRRRHDGRTGHWHSSAPPPQAGSGWG